MIEIHSHDLKVLVDIDKIFLDNVSNEETIELIYNLNKYILNLLWS